MAIQPSSRTIVDPTGDPQLAQTEISLATANGGIYTYSTDKDLYVTSVNQTIVNQTVRNITNKPAGTINGEIQFYAVGSFGADKDFRYDTVTDTLALGGQLSANYLVVGRSANLGAGANLTITGGTAGQTLLSGGDGSITWGVPISTYGDSNVAAFLSTYTGSMTTTNITASGTVAAGLVNTSTLNVVGATTLSEVDVGGNITAGNADLGNLATASYFAGDGSLLTGLNGAAVTGQVANALVAGTVYIAAQPNITSVGTLTSLGVTGAISGGSINTAGNLAAGNISTTGVVAALGNVSGMNLNTTGNVVATGSVTGQQLIGNLVGGTVTGTVATLSGNVNTGAGVSAVGNITGGNITTAGAVTAGTLSVTGAVSAPAFSGNLIGGTVTATTGAYTGNLSTTANLSATGNVTGGNITTAGVVTAAGTVTGGNFATGGNVVATGNVTAGNLHGNLIGGSVSGTTGVFSGALSGTNISTPGNVVATGNVTAGNLHGNLIGGTVAGSTGIFSGAVTGSSLSTTGSVTATGAITGGSLTTLGNVNAANINGNLVGGTVSGTTGAFSGAVNATSFNGDLVGGTVTATTGAFSGAVTAPTFNGSLVGGAVSGTTGTFSGLLSTTADITAGGNVTAGNLVGNLVGGSVAGTTGSFTGAVTATNFIGGLVGGAVSGTTGTFSGAVSGGAATFTSVAGDGSALSGINGANVTGEVSFAAVANSVAGANVTGEVGFAAVANSVAGGNVSITAGGNLVATTAAAAITELDTKKLSLSGGTLTGGLVLAADPTVPLGAATKQYVDTKAPLASPALTGTPTAPTAATGTNTTQLATTAFVQGELTAKADIASPTFTGVPAADTAATGTNTTQLATTAFVQAQLAATVPVASETAQGKVELATAAEVATGTDTSRAVTPAGVKPLIDAKVTGPASATDNAVARYDATTGKLIQDSAVTISDGGDVAGVANITVGGTSTLGPVGNVKIAGGTVGQVLSTDGSGTLAWTTISTGSIANGTSNVDVVGSANVNISAAGTANVLVVTATGANVAGTFNATGALVAPSGTFTTVGGSLTTAAQPNITSVGTLTSLDVAGTTSTVDLNASGDVTATDFIGNLIGGTVAGTTGTFSGNITTTANVTATGNVAGGNLTTTGNITATGDASIGGDVTADNFNGNLIGGTVSGSTGTFSGAVTATDFNGNLIGGTASGTTATFSGTATVGNVATAGNVVATGNVVGGNISTGGTVTATGNIAGGNITTAGNVVASGNVVAETGLVSDSLTTRTGALTLTASGTNDITLAVGTGNINLSTPARIKNLSDPVAAQDAATKIYVDALVQGLKPKAAVRVATSGDIVLAPAPAIVDGYTLVSGDRVLVKAQATTSQNGIYTFDGTNLVRATDADTVAELNNGTFVFVEAGSTFASSGFVQTSDITTLGTDPVVFSQFSTGGSYTAGSGLTLSGSQFSVSSTAVTPGSYGNATHIPTFTVSASGQLTAAGTSAVAANAQTLSGTSLNSTVLTSSLTSVGTLGTLAVTGNANVGNIGGLNGVFTSVTGSLTTAAQPAVTSVGTLTGLTVSGATSLGSNTNVSITGGTPGQVLSTTNGTGALAWVTVGAGSLSNGTSNVTVVDSANINMSAAGVSNVLVVTATGANVAGTFNATGALVAASGTFTTIGGSLTTAAQPNITSVGTLTSLAVTGGVTAASGAFTYVSGDGANLSGIVGANVTGAVAFATTANSVAGANVSGEVAFAAVANSVAGGNVTGQVANALVAGTVYTAAQPNITSVGTLTSLAVTGGVTAASGVFTYVSGDGANLSGIVGANVTTVAAGNIAATNVQAAINELDSEKLSLTGGTLTGSLVLSGDPTVALGAATKQYVDLKAPLASPALTGTPTAPTATPGDDSTQLATTAFVQAANPVASETVAGKVELATAAEVATGTDTSRAVTPAGVKPLIDAKVTGPASATDNAVARYDATTGKLVQDSVVMIGDTGEVSGVSTLTTTGDIVSGGGVKVGTVYEAGSAASTGAVDCSTSNYFVFGTTNGVAVTFGSVPTGVYSCTLEFTSDGGALDFSGVTGLAWAGGTAPSTPAAGSKLLVMLVTTDGGTTWLASSLSF